MPKSAIASARTFVDAVFRRMLIVRALERLGFGVLLGSLLALLLLPVAVWQSMPTAPILLVAVFFGLIAGCIVMVHRWPTHATAAIETDRQLRFDDLLTSALFHPENVDDGFRSIVGRLADQAVARHSPSEVLLRRYGIRSWSAIGLAMSMAVTLAIIPFGSGRSQSVDANASVLSENATVLAGSTQRQHGANPVANDPMSEGASYGQISISSEAEQTDKPESLAASPSPGTSAGSGGGRAQTPTRLSRQLPSGDSQGRSSATSGAAAGGGGVQAVGGDGHTGEERGELSGGLGNSAHRTNPASAIEAGERTEKPPGGAKTSDRIPLEDRDLIRNYFAR